MSIPIYHVAELAEWEQAQRTGAYPWSSRGVTYVDEGFVHTSFVSAVGPTLARFYADAPGPLVLLVLDTDRITAELKVEGGFPHIYGPLPVEAVVEVLPIGRDGEGAWIAPVS